jgi:anaerobic ribonucleoside-triphosphate reductase
MTKQNKKVPCIVMSRVVGYYSSVSLWNDGKLAEWKDRKTYNVPSAEELERREPLAKA